VLQIGPYQRIEISRVCTDSQLSPKPKRNAKWKFVYGLSKRKVDPWTLSPLTAHPTVHLQDWTKRKGCHEIQLTPIWGKLCDRLRQSVEMRASRPQKGQNSMERGVKLIPLRGFNG